MRHALVKHSIHLMLTVAHANICFIDTIQFYISNNQIHHTTPNKHTRTFCNFQRANIKEKSIDLNIENKHSQQMVKETVSALSLWRNCWY